MSTVRRRRGPVTSTGVDTSKAVRLLNQAGITVQAVAADLEVTPSAVYRWRTGARRPNLVNFAALRGLVDHLIAVTTAGQSLASVAQLDTLRAAKAALLTPGEVARLDQLAAQVRDTVRAARQRAETPAQRSAFAEVDPFELVRSGQPVEPALPF